MKYNFNKEDDFMKLKKEIITSEQNVNFKKISILTLLTLLIFGCFLPTFVRSIGHFEVKKRTIDTKSSSQELLASSIWDSIEKSQPNILEFDFDIFGYRIISTDADPIEYDECGQLSLKIQKSECIKINLSLKFGDYKFDRILARGHLILDSTGNYIISYNLDDPMKGFFMDLHFYSNLISIDVAFDGGDSQLCYEGVYNQGYNSIPSFIPDFFEPDRMYEDLNRISEPSPQDLKDQLLRAQKTNIIISNEKYLEDNSFSINGIEGSRSISLTNYGVAHEGREFPISYPVDLQYDYWPYSCIDIGIYRWLPSEAIVKSDLQYYNKDYVDYPLSGYIRNIKAYTMIAEGGPYWLLMYSTIYPNEISALWYSSQDGPWFTSVYPWHTIIMSDSCYSYYEPPSTNETMAKAFVDYHADAFVGATIRFTTASDTFMRAFWYDLCQGDETVETSTETLCDTHGFGWNLGDEWLIYGDEKDVLAN